MGEYWITEKERELRDKFEKDFWFGILWGNPTKREPKEDDNVKLAYVIINGERKMIGVDNKTLKGYKLREDIPHWILPLEEQPYDTFDRWCTSFDV